MNFLCWLSDRFGTIFIKISFRFSNTFSKKVDDGNLQDDKDASEPKEIGR